MNKIIHIFSLGLISVSMLMNTSCGKSIPAEQTIDIVPQPAAVTASEGTFTLKASTPVVLTFGDERMTWAANFWSDVMNDVFGRDAEVVNAVKPLKHAINVIQDESLADEEYRLNVDASGIEIAAKEPAGVFYALQTLRQMLPVAAFTEQGARVEIPACQISDKPYFAYRGFMFDMGRHIFTVDEVKDMLDILAMHKINKFHWHLTEDQGWRIEIKKYPRLTEVGSIRKSSPTGRNKGQDGKPYGGFFTQDEVRDVVKYATERFITVIPEIEIPGHSVAALAAYPELGCTGEQYEVATWWGVDERVICPGKESSFTFWEDVLTEVMELFPSEYIHIGGDECPKTFWKKCPACQKRIREEGLKNEAELQAYVTKRIEKFLNDHGRKIIGWDEILEGGLAPGATVMSWRGEGGGIAAARLHHDVIMTPNTYHYFDYYQAKDTAAEPLAIGGYLPIERVYSYEPMPRSLSPDEQRYIVGVQANLWTEYIPDMAQVQYMVLPRMAALAETQWCAPQKKVYEQFLRRTARLCRIYDVKGWNYATHIFDVELDIHPDTADGTIAVTASTIDDAPVHYTLDGSQPTAASPVIEDTIAISSDAVLRTVALRENGAVSRTTTDAIHFSKATAKPVKLLQASHPSYTFDGASPLADGLTGDRNYKTGRWIGFCGTDLETVIDLGAPTEISSAGFRTCVEKGDWIFDSRGATVLVSDDGTQFREVAAETSPAMKSNDGNGVYTHTLKFDPVTCRYVKVLVLSEHSIPEWHGAKGYPGFLFVDEITLD